MGEIEWTDRTWNPAVGCSRTSPGCNRCWAERMAARLSHNPATPHYRGIAEVGPKTGHQPRWTGETTLLVGDELDEPLRWKKPSRVAVALMGDLFHESRPDADIDLVFETMLRANQHVFQVLTKRADRMASYVLERMDRKSLFGPGMPQHIHFGVSVENRACKVRLKALRAIAPEARTWVSFEPLLEDLGEFDLRDVRWCVVGGESGPGARACNVSWIRSVVRQSRAAGCKTFVKQLGSRAYADPLEPGGIPQAIDLGDSAKGGDLRTFPEDLRLRELL